MGVVRLRWLPYNRVDRIYYIITEKRMKNKIINMLSSFFIFIIVAIKSGKINDFNAK